MWWKQRGARGLRHLLLTEWDPLGSGDVPWAKDEYDSYLGEIAQRLRSGSSAEEVAEYLDLITESMGLGPLPEHNRQTAEQLTSWYASEMAAAGSS
jgi:hypothetical protein